MDDPRAKRQGLERPEGREQTDQLLRRIWADSPPLAPQFPGKGVLLIGGPYDKKQVIWNGPQTWAPFQDSHKYHLDEDLFVALHEVTE